MSTENNRDTFTVLAENKILPLDDLERFQKMASFRNLLVHFYEKGDDVIVFGLFKNSLDDVELFTQRIVAYLKKHPFDQ